MKKVLIFSVLLLFLVGVSASATFSIDEFVSTSNSSDIACPVLRSDDSRNTPVCDAVNTAVDETAFLTRYREIAKLGNVHITYEAALGNKIYATVISAQGRMLAGRPSQVYYPMVFSLENGERLPFEAFFTDPDAAKERIENLLENEIEPYLSDYMDNASLYPVPFDRFFIDQSGIMTFYYENSDVSFLSGFSGAVSFRKSELEDLTTDLWNDIIVYGEAFAVGNRIIGLPSVPVLGESIDSLPLHFPYDSEYYPGGACLEIEEAPWRGTLLLTDSTETTVTGILTSRLDNSLCVTGLTPAGNVQSRLGPAKAVLPLDASAAALYRVCPGSAFVYEADGLNITLYADENGIIQYISFTK